MKNLLVLGGSSDIAKAIAHRYAKEGWSITLAGRDLPTLKRDVRDIEIRYRVSAAASQFDVLNTKTHPAFLKKLDRRPDGVVCAVGLLPNQATAQKDFSVAEHILSTNFVGCVSILELLAAEFERARSGFIIGISSVAGDRGRKSNYVYGSAKAGLSAYLSGLRNRLADSGVQVLTVKPGFVRTRMTEGKALPRILTADPVDVANDVFRAQHRGADVVYSRWYWRWIMLAIRSIPERVFKRMSL